MVPSFGYGAYVPLFHLACSTVHRYLYFPYGKIVYSQEVEAF